MADIAASFQEAVVDMLIKPTVKVAGSDGVSRIVLAGGVAANSRLREKMTENANAAGLEVYFPAPKFCTDNGAIVAWPATTPSETGVGMISVLTPTPILRYKQIPKVPA